MAAKLLVVDDEEDLQQLLQAMLARRGYEVLSASSGLQAIRLLYHERPDLVLLDVMMPDMDGWETLKRIREMSTVPVIMLTALGEVTHVVQGLQTGADDYVPKPFDREELIARIEALLRRCAQPTEDEDQTLSFDQGHLVIDPVCRRVMVHGQEVRLTPTEYRFLLYLAQNAGRVLTYETILANVWDVAYQGGDKNVKVYATYLRRKIEPDPKQPRYICSERGVGYYMPKL
ncbi:MAG: response regulator transcription factor [Anaerolineae bacterium]|nr:response regulator transcription factor [Anaerolineae bacterium]